MSDRQQDLAADLVDVLDRENEALKRLDFPAAVALVPAKVKALEALARRPIPPTIPTAQQQRLGRLVAENQALLERAIEIQTRIVMIVARAAPAPVPAIGYSGHGNGSSPVRTEAMAVSTRA